MALIAYYMPFFLPIICKGKLELSIRNNKLALKIENNGFYLLFYATI